MKTTVDYYRLSPQSVQALMALEKSLADSPLGHGLMDLVKIRVSQLNGCLFCIDMHSKEAKIHGERELRLYHLSAWHESPLFTEKEKAALEWAELVTKIAVKDIAEENLKKVLQTFSEKEVSDLTFVVGAINMWNRFGVAFKPTPGGADKAFGLEKAGLT